MNRSFQSYVTSQAFVISLSAPMIECLAWFAMNNTEKAYYPTVPYLTSLHALKRRGLMDSGHGPQGQGPFLTEEGKLVYELCKRAGLIAKITGERKAA